LKVGFGKLPLTQRVQLAALAHIRHTKTRYDELLKEGVRWENARKAVEGPCLNVIFKWRGDEETGRDQLDEILREVIEISDSEDESEDESSREETPVTGPSRQPEATFSSRSYPMVRQPGSFMGGVAATPRATPRATPGAATPNMQREASVILLSPEPLRRPSRKERKAAKQAKQRFKRYYQIAESFRHEPREPDMARPYEPEYRQPVNAPEHMQVPRTQEYSQAPIAHPAPVSAPVYLDPYYSGATRNRPPEVVGREPVYRDDFPYSDAPMYHAGSSRERIRGQSPVLVRVLDGSEPRVGPPSDRQGYGQSFFAPARNQLQDMVVQSIEPRSPGGAPRYLEQVSYLPAATGQHYEPPRVISRTIVHQPLGYTHPPPPAYVSDAENIRYMRRPVTTQPESLDPLSSAGFVQIHRMSERKPKPYYPPEVPVSRSRISEHPVSYSGSRARSPVVYYVDSPRPDHGEDPSRARVRSVLANNTPGHVPAEASYRTRANPIYVDDPARIRNHTAWEAPRPVERIIERRDYR
jgi:hypothetical protein